MKSVDNLIKLKNLIPNNIKFVVVSKTQTPEQISKLYQSGQRDFGENKVQELMFKSKVLPKDIRWHMIGRLQRNKVKYIVPFVELIHSVDNVTLWREIEKQGKNIGRKIPCLLQIKISSEESKAGMTSLECNEILKEYTANSDSYTYIQGLMGMASFTTNPSTLNKEFGSLHHLFNELKQKYDFIQILSMGMTGDYQYAIENGSNMIRIGSLIFR